MSNTENTAEETAAIEEAVKAAEAELNKEPDYVQFINDKLAEADPETTKEGVFILISKDIAAKVLGQLGKPELVLPSVVYGYNSYPLIIVERGWDMPVIAKRV